MKFKVRIAKRIAVEGAAISQAVHETITRRSPTSHCVLFRLPSLRPTILNAQYPPYPPVPEIDRLTIDHRTTAHHAIDREVLPFSECLLLRTLAVLLVICCAASCFGQSPQVNNVTVAIKAAGDLPIAGATCTLVSVPSTPDHTLAAVSDNLGLARFTNVVPGNYTLTVTKAGFDKLTRSSVVIKDQPESEIQVVLSTANVQHATVAAPSEISTSVEVGAGTTSGNLQRNTIESLPVATARIGQALPLIPGVLRSAKGELSIKGGTEQQSASLIDGANTNDPATGNFRLARSYEGPQVRQPQVANTDAPPPASSENAPAPAATAQQQTDNDIPGDPTARLFQLVLPSEHLLGDWGGLRTKLEESGITPRLMLVTDLAGNPRGGRSQGATAPSSVELSLFFDLEKIFGLKGGSIFASFSERWGHSLSAKYIGNTFSTQQIFGFQTYRVIDVSYQQKLLDDRVELRLGRFAATDDFLVSPYNFGFMQNAFCGNPFGILLDAPGMSAYYGTWAALGKVKPTRRSYVMTGIYNGDPKIRENKYHGVNLSLKGPLFSITEAGYQINGLPGDSRRLGNYKLGAWYDHAKLTDFETDVSKRGSWGYYGLFDQVLVPFGSPTSNRGLGVFGSVTVAPDSRIQQLPLFFTAGVSVRGLFNARPRDVVGLAVASGYFSEDLKRAQRNGRMLGPGGGVPDRETVMEMTYRFDFRKGAFFIQPDFQVINRTGGTGHFKTAPVLGAQIGINF
jgi:porin